MQLLDTEGAIPGQPFSFIVDATGTGGLGDVSIDIVHDKQSVPFRIEDIGHMRYRTFMVPHEAGKYRVYLYFNGSDVRGSPISIRVGTHRSRRSKESTSYERSKTSSLEKRMNGLNLSDHTSTSQKRQSPVYKSSQSPTQNYRDYSHHQSTYKTSNYTTENSSSAYHVPSPLTASRSPVQSNSSPSLIKESREIYSSSTFNRSRSPNVTQSPSLIKESKDVYASSSLNRSRSPVVKDTQSSTVIKESKDIYQSSTLNRSRSPAVSPMAFRTSNGSPINRSFSPRVNEKDFGRRRGSADNGVIDTSSNVRGKIYFIFFLQLSII